MGLEFRSVLSQARKAELFKAPMASSKRLNGMYFEPLGGSRYFGTKPMCVYTYYIYICAGLRVSPLGSKDAKPYLHWAICIPGVPGAQTYAFVHT